MEEDAVREPVLIHGRNANEVMQILNGTAMPMDGKVMRCPMVLSINHPDEICVFGEHLPDPLQALSDAVCWLRDAAAPLDMIKQGIQEHGVPQQLLTIGQSVSLTFMVNDRKLDLSVHYSCRDVRDAVLTTDFPAFVLGQQLLAAMTEREPGKVFIYIAQPVLQDIERDGVRDPYVHEIVSPFQHTTDVDTFIRDLSTLLADGPVVGIVDPFVKKVIGPILVAKRELDEGHFERARRAVRSCRASDWQLACLNHIDDAEAVHGSGRT
jgi:hypothetical protein